jgi:chorismate synthase
LEAQTCFTTTAKGGVVEGQSHSENISTEIAGKRTPECRIQAQMTVNIEDL